MIENTIHFWSGQRIKSFLPPSLNLKKVTALKIFGLNLTLHAREARGVAEIQWASIAEAHCLENKIPFNLLMVSVYRSARTYFSRN